jgi:hypothetical protein
MAGLGIRDCGVDHREEGDGDDGERGQNSEDGFVVELWVLEERSKTVEL